MSDQDKQPADLQSFAKVIVEGSDSADGFRLNNRDGELTGAYRRNGMSIDWRGKSDFGVEPLDTIEATIHRLQFEQTSDLASNTNAKALIYMMQARDALTGKEDTTTDDGLPIIE
jgi:hypothetical protein